MRLLLALPFVLACSRPVAAVTQSEPPGATVSPQPNAPTPVRVEIAPVVDSGVAAIAPTISESDAARILFGTSPVPPCDADGGSPIECLIAMRYRADPISGQMALTLFRETGDVAGVGRDELMDGGFRGQIHLVPEIPKGADRRHLEWVVAALRDFDGFFGELDGGKVAYRWRALAIRFMRSIGRTTPSAYASPWSMSYNLSGSLFKDADHVRETLFHEIFHMNDANHRGWSERTLTPDYDRIRAKCKGPLAQSVACLAPYAPGDTKVRGGTYYAFQENNGDSVNEYGAELALRWYREQRAALRKERLATRPFKCGPPENARAWTALANEFFAGVDHVPPCP